MWPPGTAQCERCSCILVGTASPPRRQEETLCRQPNMAPTPTVTLNTMPEGESRERSASTLSRMFRPDPTEETPVHRPSISSHGRVSLCMALQHPYHKEDPSLKYYPFWSFSFVIKLLQVLTTIVCAGLYTTGLEVICTSVTSQMFPNIVFACYLLITPVILLSYVLGQKMPELLIRIFNVLGAILFFVAGTISLTEWEVKHRQYLADLDAAQQAAAELNVTSQEALDDVMEELEETCRTYTEHAGFMLLSEGALSLVNACLYLADVAFSIKRTLSYL